MTLQEKKQEEINRPIALYVAIWIFASIAPGVFMIIGQRFGAIMYSGGLVTGWLMHAVVASAIRSGKGK